MLRKCTAILLTAILILGALPMAVSAASLPTAWKAPASLTAAVPASEKYSTNLHFSVDSEALKFIDPAQTNPETNNISSLAHTAQVDWKLNDGNWHYASDWDTLSGQYPHYIYADTGYLSGEVTDDVTLFDLRDEEVRKALGSAVTLGATEEANQLDLANNTFSFRVRLYVSYDDTAAGTSKYILSPWSETLTYGKGSNAAPAPTKLDKPTISNPKVGKNDDGSPNITITAITPKQVQDANAYTTAHESALGAGASITVEHQLNINNTGWVDVTAGAGWLSGETRTINVPLTYDNGKTVQVDSANIQVRMRYVFHGGQTVGKLQSEWSNLVSVNTPAWTNASQWATPELQKASDLGLIPEILKGADMTKPITREEFCELSVLLHDKTTGKTSEPAAPNPFNDTTNPQILKALKLGITSGTSANTFSPNVLINREQCAAMLFRAIKAIKPAGDYSIAGVKDFPDQQYVSPWAVEATKYMSKSGIITGDAKGNFMPKAITSTQEAAGYGMATREQAIALSVRTYNGLK